MTLRPLLIALICGTACSRDQSLRQEHVTQQVPPAQRPTTVHASPLTPAGDSADPAIPDSVLRRVTALEDSLARDSTGARAAGWLWQLGTVTKVFLGGMSRTGRYGAYARAHSAQYDYSEPDATFVYNGFQFSEIVRRFPGDTLADRAGYELTKLDIVGECEGDVHCYIERQLIPLRTFLGQFPRSSLARDAVLRANKAFETILGYKPQPFDAWEVDSAAVRGDIAGYDSTARVLPPTLRALAMPTIERLRSQWKVSP